MSKLKIKDEVIEVEQTNPDQEEFFELPEGETGSSKDVVFAELKKIGRVVLLSFETHKRVEDQPKAVGSGQRAKIAYYIRGENEVVYPMGARVLAQALKAVGVKSPSFISSQTMADFRNSTHMSQLNTQKAVVAKD